MDNAKTKSCVQIVNNYDELWGSDNELLHRDFQGDILAHVHMDADCLVDRFNQMAQRMGQIINQIRKDLSTNKSSFPACLTSRYIDALEIHFTLNGKALQPVPTPGNEPLSILYDPHIYGLVLHLSEEFEDCVKKVSDDIHKLPLKLAQGARFTLYYAGQKVSF